VSRIPEERGSVTVWLALASFVMMALVGLAVDLGGQVHTQQRAHDLAAQAARAGAEQVQAAPAIEGRYAQIDAVAARAAAQAYLDGAGVNGTVSISGGDTITVTVSDIYDPRFLAFLGIKELHVSSTASARLVRSLGGIEQ
jgi:Flp pilus assembly protein TadG